MGLSRSPETRGCAGYATESSLSLRDEASSEESDEPLPGETYDPYSSNGE